MKKFFQLICLFFLVLLAFCIPVLIALYLGRTLWAGLIVSTAILGTILTFLFFRSLWMRWREKKFIDGILDQDQAPGGRKEKKYSGELARQWKEAMGELKRSHLKQLGNPLYVLPWYMVMGESGSGKTTALKNSGLSSKIASPAGAPGVSGTKNCNWWFFEQAIVIDTAGRYAIQQDEVSDRNDWRTFLIQLAKFRKKEPLNGLVITVSADKVIKSTPKELKEEGQKIRVRIEELMLTLGAKFPVYVLVTKCDLVHGMKPFCDNLPDESSGQAFGYLNQDLIQDTDSFTDKAFEKLTETIRTYRLRISNKAGHEKVEPEVLLFPEEFERLKSGLKPFVSGVFDETVYLEAPVLRGVYFTSGRQSGEPFSHFIDALGLDVEKEAVPSSDKSYFLHDFFSKILPRDRGLFIPTRKAMAWKKKTRTIGFSAWAAVVAVFCGLMSYSFAVNLSTIKEFQRDFSTPPVLSGELISDVNTLEKFRAAILKIEQRNQRRWLPRFGLSHCDQIEEQMKKAYCTSFRKDFLFPYDKKLFDMTLDFTKKTPPEQIGRIIPHYTKRINLLEARLADNTFQVIGDMPKPDYSKLLISPGQKVIPKVLDVFENQYHHYLVWAPDMDVLEEKKQLSDRLDHVLTKKDISLRWLVTWCNETVNTPELKLGDFWGGSRQLKYEETIRPAYTVKGHALIMEMLEELEKAFDDPLDLEKKKLLFKAWYRNSYIDEWYSFSRLFASGMKKLKGEEEKRAVAKKMASDDGPYFALLSRMAVELVPCVDEVEELPVWIALVFEFDEIKTCASKTKMVNKNGMVAKVAKKGMRLLGKMGNASASGTGVPDSILLSAESYKDYMNGLKGISKACASPAASFKLATKVFGEDIALGDSHVFVAKRAEDELKVSMQNYLSSQKTFSKLLGGPMNYLWGFVCNKAGCHIQNIWEESVLSEVEGVYDKKVVSDLLLGDKGYVRKFTDGHASPFIGRNRKRGYYSRTVAGRKIPFNKEFFSYLTRGAYSAKSEKDVYRVTLKGMPTDTNPDAKLIPHVTKLELECAEGLQVLENYNYPVKRTFVWSPRDCGNVTLKVSIGNQVLTKEYTGFRPFAKFVKDFSKGQCTYFRSDFPEKSQALKRMGIKYIKVKYNISGGRPVIRLLNMAAGKAPEVIVTCSD